MLGRSTQNRTEATGFGDPQATTTPYSYLAERSGFEPLEVLTPRRLSRALVSATHPSFHGGRCRLRTHESLITKNGFQDRPLYLFGQPSIGAQGGNRTRDGGFAIRGLTAWLPELLARDGGLEPPTTRLTTAGSAVELVPN
jgi:hypothetical protein